MGVKHSTFIAWIEATRLRTLPVSLSGVTVACAYSLLNFSFSWLPAILCLLVALLAQISSNYANEYYDFINGLDKPGREGPRRGVTEGDITPRAMKHATFISLALACLCGIAVIPFAGLWLIPLGLLIVLGVYAYSAGPFPLSRNGLGEIAVIIFYGIIPVCSTSFILCDNIDNNIFLGALSIGLLGANVLVINNYRDTNDDRAVNKKTLSVLCGPGKMPWLYALNAIIAYILMWKQWSEMHLNFIPTIFTIFSLAIAFAMTRLTGHRLTPLLGMTAILLFLYSLTFLLTAIF